MRMYTSSVASNDKPPAYPTSSKPQQAASSTASAACPTSENVNKPYGIQLLHDGGPDSIVDIVFVHGLTGRRYDTWRAEGEAEPWPKKLLPHALSPLTVRIFSTRFDSNIAGWTGKVDDITITKNADDLLHDLSMTRERDGLTDRPIIFVCHSLGGLVCKQALISAQNSLNKIENSIYTSTRALAFMGTPYHTSTMSAVHFNLVGIIGSLWQTTPEVFRLLKVDPGVLGPLEQAFQSMLMRREHGTAISVICFYEALPWSSVYNEVVPKHCAIIPGLGQSSIHANHINMTKFAHSNNSDFKKVVGELQRWIGGTTQNPARGSHDNSPFIQAFVQISD